MGNLLSAKCRCGTEYNHISFGGVKSNHKTVCMVPAIDHTTGKFEVVNYYDHVPKSITTTLLQRWFGRKTPITMSAYTFYNDPKLQTVVTGKYPTIGFGPVTLNSTQNFCPNCQNYTLNFQIIAYTD